MRDGFIPGFGAGAVLAIGMMLLGACFPQVEMPARPHIAPPAPAVTKPLDLKPICQKVKPYSQTEADALANAIAELPASSPLIIAMGDYKSMRDTARACASKATQK